MALVTVPRATEMYGYSEEHFHVLASSNRRRGVDSPWYKQIDNQVWIDTVLYERNNNIQQACQDYNTTFLYWLCLQVLGNDTTVARYLADKSHRFNTVTSWVMFFQHTMWLPTDTIQSAMRYTMQTDFTVLASRLVYIELKGGRKFVDEWS